MYAILSEGYTIVGFETRNLPLDQLVHPDFAHLYIPIETTDGLKLGDIWHPDTKTWEIIPDPPVDVPTPDTTLEAITPGEIENAIYEGVNGK